MRKPPCRHGNRNRAQQQADHGRQRQEPLRAIGRGKSTFAAFLLALQPERLRQLILDRVVIGADRGFLAGNQQGITHPAAFPDQAAGGQITGVDQQGRRQRGEADRLIRPVGDDGGNQEVQLADRKKTADVGANPGQQGIVGPDLAGRRDLVGVVRLAEELVGNPQRAPERITVRHGDNRG